MSGCFPFCATDVSTDGCDVLLLGLSGAGKTLLCRRLQGLYEKEATAVAFTAQTVPTNGQQVSEVPCPRGTSGFKTIVVREVGGQMSPLWPQYFDDCRMVVFVVDVANAASISPAALELYELIQHPSLKGKPICVCLSKQDQALVLSRQDVELVMHLSDLERSLQKDRFAVIELASIPGSYTIHDGRREVDAAEMLLEWMIDQKSAALGLSAPRRDLPVTTDGLFTKAHVV